MPFRLGIWIAATLTGGLLLLSQTQPVNEERLARHRNLGKAFYENPATPSEAVAEFEAALKLAPNSAREQLNYALALLRAGKTAEGVAALEALQKRDPSLPHTWFNLGIQYRKAGEFEKATQQFEQMVKLVPDEPISRYQLGALYRAAGRNDEAEKQLKEAAKLDPNLAAPHFQLFNLYRTTGRAEQAKTELARFQEIKKQQEGAVIPEDVEWSAWSEIYDPAPGPREFKPMPLSFRVAPTTAVREKPADLPEFARKYQKAVWLDYDHDYDLDLFLFGPGSVLMRNRGAAGFEDRTADFPFVAGEVADAVPIRAVPDTRGFDLLVTYKDGQSRLYRDHLAGKYTVEAVDVPRGATKLQVIDHGNDGDFDVLYVVDGSVGLSVNARGKFTASGFRAKGESFAVADPDHRGTEDLIVGRDVYGPTAQGYEKRTAIEGLPESCEQMDTVDRNVDALPDLVCVSGGKTVLATNQTKTPYKWIGVKLSGVRNIKTAPFSEVEVKAGALYQKKLYMGREVVFGLGSNTVADAVRITWPNGLIQGEVRQPAGKRYTYVEAQRLSGSCPIIWTWNGRGFDYITDVLGVAPLGASSGDGEYFATDHDEWISIPGESLREQDGSYEIRITEELSEVAYLDHVRLTAVDHPSELSVYTNEKFKAPPFPEFRLFGVRQKRPVQRAVEDSGRDVTELVKAKDRTYPDGFARDLSGVAEKHSLTLELGERPPGEDLLVLSGWVDWADGSTFLNRAQQGRGGLVPPYLQVREADGSWRTVLEDMGMPAGKPKTIVVKLPEHAKAVRIVTNLCVYWDEIFVARDEGVGDVRLIALHAQTADLRFRGFSPSVIHPERKHPERFSYDGAQPVSLWNPTPGLYTRYGTVRELTKAVDDRLVVMGSGDELRLKFPASKLPPLPAGWRRDFLLLVDGWAKDRDANTAFGQSTEPLPFHAMKTYPYEGAKPKRDEYLTRPALRLIRPMGELTERSQSFTPFEGSANGGIDYPQSSLMGP